MILNGKWSVYPDSPIFSSEKQNELHQIILDASNVGLLLACVLPANPGLQKSFHVHWPTVLPLKSSDERKEKAPPDDTVFTKFIVPVCVDTQLL